MGTSVEPRPRAAPREPVAGGARPQVASRLREPTTIVLALTVLAATLRFATLNTQSIWLDESATMVLVHRGLGGVLSHLPSSESAPPLYYILAWAWTKVLGAGPLGFRSLSALAGTLTVPVMYTAGRRISPRAGLWAAALATVNPAMYYYSQEARCYALLILFSAAALALWQRALETPDRRRLALWAGMSMLAVLTHYFAAFLFIPEAIVLARRLGWRRALAPAGSVVLVGIALLPLALRERADGKSNWIEGASQASRVAEAAKQFLVGLYSPLQIFSAALAGLLAAGAIALLLRHGGERERRGAQDIAVVAVAAVGLPLLLAVTHLLDVFDGRNVIAAWAPWAVLIAIGLAVARASRTGTLLGAGLCAVSLAVIVGVNAMPGYQRDDWRGAAEALPAQPAGRVILAPQNASVPLSIYLPEIRTGSGTSVSTREVDFIDLRTRRTAGSPLPPMTPTKPPPGFQLAGFRRTDTYAVARFLATRPTTLGVAALRRMSESANAEVILQR